MLWYYTYFVVCTCLQFSYSTSINKLSRYSGISRDLYSSVAEELIERLPGILDTVDQHWSYTRYALRTRRIISTYFTSSILFFVAFSHVLTRRLRTRNTPLAENVDTFKENTSNFVTIPMTHSFDTWLKWTKRAGSNRGSNFTCAYSWWPKGSMRIFDPPWRNQEWIWKKKTNFKWILCIHGNHTSVLNVVFKCHHKWRLSSTKEFPQFSHFIVWWHLKTCVCSFSAYGYKYIGHIPSTKTSLRDQPLILIPHMTVTIESVFYNCCLQYKRLCWQKMLHDWW